jgi:hypothetical protein
MKSLPSSSGLLVVENSTGGGGGLDDSSKRMDDFATVQTEMKASIDSQTSMLHDLFDHFGINPDA